MPKVGSVLQFVGGAIGRTAASGLVIGFFFVVFGMLPWEAAALIYQNPPAWMGPIWVRLGVLILGLGVIWASLNFNRWSKKQQAIDSLSEDIAWAIHNLLNRNPPPRTNAEIDKWQADFNDWCERVSRKLENRAFFTRADQLHFDVLGFIDRIALTGTPNFDALLSQLRLKFDRLRDVINWTQQRR
jgi:hypothetical protein